MVCQLISEESVGGGGQVDEGTTAGLKVPEVMNFCRVNWLGLFLRNWCGMYEGELYRRI